jgi:hypothetical protein
VGHGATVYSDGRKTSRDDCSTSAGVAHTGGAY